MRLNRPKRTEQIVLLAEPDLRAAIEAEAVRRDTSMSSTIRALVRAQLAAIHSGNQQVAA